MVMYGEVTEVERLTPHLVRVHLGGEGLASFTPTPFTDQYVNALFVPDGSPCTVPFDVDEAKTLPAEHRPRGRRYTIRSWDESARVVAIDFVVHGDVGYAGRWANAARPGDRLQIVGPSGGYAPDPSAPWHLLVGDESALPAIGASLERLEAGARAVVVVVVDDEDHQVELPSRADVDLHWVHRATAPGDHTLLAAAVERLDFHVGTPQVFVHGEAAEVRAIRRHLVEARGIPKEGASISPYWRRDHTDEQWREVKQQWLADSEADLQAR